MSKVIYQGMEFDEEELEEIRKENRNNQSSIDIFEFTRMVNPFNFDYDRYKTYKAIVTDVPGSGKTTAIFQYMKYKLKMLSTYHAVYSASRIEDVYHMFEKFVAEFGDEHKFSLFTSDKNYCNVKDLNELYYSKIIFLCHERLFIEPISLIYNVKYTELEDALFTLDLSYKRDDIFIDEIPSNLYRSLSLEQKSQLELLNCLAFGKDRDYFRYVVGKDFQLDEKEVEIFKNNARANFIKSSIQARTEKRLLTKSINTELVGTNQSLALSLKAIDNAPTTINNPSKSITKDIAGVGINSQKGLFMLKRLTYFINVFASKYEKDPTAEYILYSPDDFDCKRLIFFSGTGDLLARNSSKYKIVNSREGVTACRYLDLYDNLQLVSPRLLRKATSDLIAKEYSEILIKILEDNPEETILVYLWKDSKNKDEKEILYNYDYELNDNYSILPARILKLIPNELQNRIKFITYQSGKEQSTNEYLDCGIMVIFGEFFVPQYVIDCRNKVFDSKSTIKDYTKHLMIQAVYRTRARKHFDSDKYIFVGDNKIKANSIKLYIDDRYGMTFIQSLLKEFKLVNCDSINSVKIRPKNIYLSDFEIPEDFISEKSFAGNDRDDYFIITSKNLASLISDMKIVSTAKLKRILDNKNICYEVINPNSKGRSNYTLYKIYPYRIEIKSEYQKP